MTAKVPQCVSGFSPVLTSEKFAQCISSARNFRITTSSPPQTIFCTCLQGKLGVPGLPGYPGRQGPKVIKNCLTFNLIFESFKSAADQRHSLCFFLAKRIQAACGLLDAFGRECKMHTRVALLNF